MDARCETEAKAVAVVHYPGRAYSRLAPASRLLLALVELADPLPQLLSRLVGRGVHLVPAAASLHQRRPDRRHQPGPTGAENLRHSDSHIC